jgi:hypothetical protein
MGPDLLGGFRAASRSELLDHVLREIVADRHLEAEEAEMAAGG